MKGREFLLLAGPSAAAMVLLMLAPMLMLLGISFYSFHLGGVASWVGLENYADTLGSARFWSAVGWTLIYVAITVPLELALGLGVALLLDELRGGRGLAVASVLLPFIVTPVVGTVVYSWLFKDPWGFYVQGLALLGIEFDYASSAWGSRALLMLYRVWAATPFAALVFFAGLQSAPVDRMEAAAIDGAGPWGRFVHVTLPHLRPLLLFVAMIAVMDNWREFDSVFVMTHGGPGSATATVMYLTYSVAFAEQALGRGAALACLTVVGIALLLAPFVRSLWRENRT